LSGNGQGAHTVQSASLLRHPKTPRGHPHPRPSRADGNKRAHDHQALQSLDPAHESQAVCGNGGRERQGSRADQIAHASADGEQQHHELDTAKHWVYIAHDHQESGL